MPRYLVVADLHASAPSIATVLAHAGPFDGLVSLGDVVGYGPHPNEAVEFVRQHAAYAVLGNHDQACFDDSLLWWFNGSARQAVMFSRKHLLPANVDYLRSLPLQAGVGPFVFIHSSLTQMWGYVRNGEEAISNLTMLRQYRRRILLVGHTHLSEVYRMNAKRLTHKVLKDGDVVDLSGDDAILLNPGSASQPRDGDTRLGFGLLDTDAMTYTQRRVAWDIAALQSDMRTLRLPDYLIARLNEGR